ncbi:hypothetical protein APX70_00558 [Pseudomonas syringae pv. maculicola]|uniref:Uncharacterized protein n=1 Tax=Pseudomonas syringae pv. maculicola TaxID=59511 RepID=A0A3M2WEX4_PSEYM|nr:hypothetical protein APX70_00558 [Pseudomonas syringae pv. maculicola]
MIRLSDHQLPSSAWWRQHRVLEAVYPLAFGSLRPASAIRPAQSQSRSHRHHTDESSPGLNPISNAKMAPTTRINEFGFFGTDADRR